MSWSEIKVHKQGAAHQLQDLQFAQSDFSNTTESGSSHNGDAFQATTLCQSGPPSDTATFQPTSQLHGESVATGPGHSGQKEQDPDNSVEQEKGLNDLLCALTTGLEELGRLRENVLQNSNDDLLRLVISIAEQVVHCDVKTNPKIITLNIQRALQVSINSSEYHVKVHPDDLAIVMEKKPQFLASVNGLENITLEADECVSRGGCLVESELGQVDASIEGQFEELRQQLLPAVVNL